MAIAFDPHTLDTLKTSEIFNITRVLFMPFVILILAFYAVGRKRHDQEMQVRTGKLVREKFPLFVLGFLAMTTLMSLGTFTESQAHSLRELMVWCFAVGLAGLGMNIRFNIIRQTGGKALFIGVGAGLFKTVASLLVIKWYFRI